MKKRTIPFGVLPGHWGLSGKTRELAKAEWELDGEELERSKVKINLLDRSEKEVELALLEIDRKYNKIDDHTFDRKKIEINIADRSEKEIEVALLEVDRKYDKIDEHEFDRKKALALKEPYVRVAKIETDPTNPAFGGIILDWNKEFVFYLEEHGYGPHPTDEETVNQWFNEVCKNIALEAFDGEGDFSERIAERPRTGRRGMSDDVIIPSRHPRDIENDE